MQYNLPIFLLIFSVVLFLIEPESGRTQKPPPIHESVKFTDITEEVSNFQFDIFPLNAYLIKKL